MSFEKKPSWVERTRANEDYDIANTQTDLAVSLETQIEQQGLSQKDFAARLNKSQAYVSKLLRGDENLTIRTMVRIARALGCKLHINMAPADHKVRFHSFLHNPDAPNKTLNAAPTAPKIVSNGSKNPWARPAKKPNSELSSAA